MSDAGGAEACSIRRRGKDLQFAERRINKEREKQNPTFTVASLVDDQKEPLPEETESTPEDGKERAREDVRQLLGQDFAYLD